MSETVEVDLQEVHDFLIEVAIDAGAFTKNALVPTEGGPASLPNYKLNTTDLVTATDKAVEDRVREKLLEKYPTFAVIGEESYEPASPTSAGQVPAGPTFIVDPIDGTTNFVHRQPYFCISIGLAIARRPCVGVIYNALTAELYSAIAGRGVWKANRDVRIGAYLPSLSLSLSSSSPSSLPPSSLPPVPPLAGALVAVEWGAVRAGNDWEVKSKTFCRLARDGAGGGGGGGGGMVQGFRSLGSAALNLCALAEGRLDAYWEAGVWPWDVCAGFVILTEAGGLVTDANPGAWEVGIEDRRFLAIRPGAACDQKKLVEQIWGHVVGRLEVGTT